MKRHFFSYDTKTLAPFIDWSYFLHAWGIKAGMHNRIEAQEIIDEAKELLKELQDKECARALFALCDAHSCGDDIVVEGRAIPMLRQQHNDDKPNLCLSDFVSPHDDRIGLFATCATEDFAVAHSNDPLHNLLVQTLAGRLAEAAATLMHREVRTKKEFWGYAPDEQLTIEQLNREEFQGIRPAVGYPSLPDQSVIFIIDSLLETKEIGIELSPNGAMHPHAAVCGLMLSHPAAHYFSVGKISHEQLHDYASRRSMSAENVQKFLTKNIE